MSRDWRATGIRFCSLNPRRTISRSCCLRKAAKNSKNSVLQHRRHLRQIRLEQLQTGPFDCGRFEEQAVGPPLPAMAFPSTAPLLSLKLRRHSRRHPAALVLDLLYGGSSKRTNALSFNPPQWITTRRIAGFQENLGSNVRSVCDPSCASRVSSAIVSETGSVQ